MLIARPPAFSKRQRSIDDLAAPALGLHAVGPVAAFGNVQRLITPRWQPTMSIAEPPLPQRSMRQPSMRKSLTPESLMPSRLPAGPTSRTTRFFQHQVVRRRVPRSRRRRY